MKPEWNLHSAVALSGWALIALPVVATAASIEGEIYGDLRYAYSHYDDKGAEPRSNRFDDTDSHAGLAVTTREGDYAATLVYERALESDDSNPDAVRQSYLSVSTPYGTALYGRAPTAYKLSGEVLDPFYNTAVGTINGAAFGTASAAVRGPSYGLSALTSDARGNGFVANQVAYVSPSMGGLRVNAAFFMNESDPPEDDHDYGAGAEWSGDWLEGSATAGVQYLDVRSSANFSAIGVPGSGAVKATRLYAAYTRDSWGLSASWEPLDLKSGPDRDYVLGTGWLGLTEQTRVALAWGYTDGTPFEGNSVSLGLFHSLFEGLEVYAAARYTDRNKAPQESTNIGVGVTYTVRFKGERSL